MDVGGTGDFCSVFVLMGLVDVDTWFYFWSLRKRSRLPWRPCSSAVILPWPDVPGGWKDTGDGTRP